MITAGSGKYLVWLKEEKLSDERLYILGGGERPHIGGVVVMEPNSEPKSIKLKGHYDHIVLEPIAKEACKKYNTKVVVIGGVHVDSASKDEIDILVKNCKELVKCI
ncbi:MAG: hypothetical protein JSV56_07150 [Methanomassiliicoccales archaeon]|nr:MAG: hypothetical protein JSV56_07150 [Methanomassiliicoccales archaeon]